MIDWCLLLSFLSEYAGQAHMTFAIVDRSAADGAYILKPLKQKQFVDGLPYLLQEIYGIENKLTEKCKVSLLQWYNISSVHQIQMDSS